MSDDIPTLPSYQVVRVRWPRGQPWVNPGRLLRMDPVPDWVEVLAWTRHYRRAQSICLAINRPGGDFICIVRLAAPDAPIARPVNGDA